MYIKHNDSGTEKLKNPFYIGTSSQIVFHKVSIVDLHKPKNIKFKITQFGGLQQSTSSKSHRLSRFHEKL